MRVHVSRRERSARSRRRFLLLDRAKCRNLNTLRYFLSYVSLTNIELKLAFFSRDQNRLNEFMVVENVLYIT